MIPTRFGILEVKSTVVSVWSSLWDEAPLDHSDFAQVGIQAM